MIESIRAFNDRISKIQDQESLTNEARKITRRIDIFYGVPATVGVAGILGGLSLLKSEAISPELAYGIFLISFGITYIPYIDLFGDARSFRRKEILEERASRLNVDLPKGPTERITDVAVSIVFRKDTGKKQ